MTGDAMNVRATIRRTRATRATRAVRRTRGAVLAASLLALAATFLSTVGPAAQSAHATTFTVYNQTQGDWHNWSLEQFGLADNAAVYDQWGLSCSTTGCGNVPSQATFEAAVKSAVGTFKAAASAPLVLDLENILPVSATSAGQAQQDLALYEKLATWAHDAEPAAPLGIYSYDYSTAYSSSTEQLYTGGYLQFFAPSMYNRWATVADWENELNAAVANDHAMDSALPIYPYLWPQWDNGGSGQLSGPDWNTEFGRVQALTQGAIVWADSATTLGAGSCGWLGDLAREMSLLTGTQSSGPLTVTTKVPGTCETDRGSATSVQVTLTNAGGSATAATTLRAASGPQGITESYGATVVPSLAAGASWSTTLSLTVPSSETDQTALLKIDYGTGSGRLTVIVP
jgi:hypothetical protein